MSKLGDGLHRHSQAAYQTSIELRLVRWIEAKGLALHKPYDPFRSSFLVSRLDDHGNLLCGSPAPCPFRGGVGGRFLGRNLLAFLHYLHRVFIIAETDEADVPKVLAGRLFEKAELRDRLRSQPNAFTHSSNGHACPPAPRTGLRKVRERANIRL